VCEQFAKIASSLKENKFDSGSIRAGCGNISSPCNRICAKSAEPSGVPAVVRQAKVRLLDTLMTYHIIIAGFKCTTDFNNSLRSEYALDIIDRDYGQGRRAM
jgi:hypothetical protein